jgi:hypothetical protein
VLCALLLAGASLATGCSSGGSKQQPAEAEKQPHADPIKAVVPLPKGSGLVAQRGWAIGPITTSAGQLLWTAASSDETSDVLLLKRDLATRRTTVAAHRLFQAFGLASAAGSVVYATRSGKHAQLASRPIAGGRPTVLSNDLAAPFDARGDMLAWAEANGSQNRVLVRDMRKGRTSVAYSGARCRQTRCYRIDRVTVADDGVVFDLGAVGQGYPSLMVRRGWNAKQPEIVNVPRDPQPDLARSSAGALYYQLGHGWMEWDFGRARPTPTWPHGLRPWLLSRDADRDLVLGGPTCSTTAAVHIGTRLVAVRAPRSTPVSAKGFGKLCRQLAGFAWSGNRLVLAWTLTPRISIEAHEEIGVSSVITSTEIG